MSLPLRSADQVRANDRTAAFVARAKGKIDVLFANAGIGGRARLGEIADKHIDDLLSINIKGVILTVQKANAQLDSPGARLRGTVAIAVAVIDPGLAACRAQRR